MSEVTEPDTELVIQADLWPIPGRPGFWKAGQNGRPLNGVIVPGSAEQCMFLDYTRNGAHLDTACDLTGVSRETVYNWQRIGAKHLEWLEAGSPDPRPNNESMAGLCAYFVLEYRKAEATAKMSKIEVWSMVAESGDWRAARDFLARRWPEEWREQREQIRSDTRGIDGPERDTAPPDLAKIIAALHEAGVTSKDLAIETTATEVTSEPETD